jgi:hypothetical protein
MRIALELSRIDRSAGKQGKLGIKFNKLFILCVQIYRVIIFFF